MLSDGTGVHECLRDDREHGVHVVRCLHVEDELRVLHDVDPETQREAARRRGDDEARSNADPRTSFSCAAVGVRAPSKLPVGLPDVYRLRVGDAVLACLVVQQVEKIFDGQRNRTAGAEDDSEEVVHKLL